MKCHLRKTSLRLGAMLLLFATLLQVPTTFAQSDSSQGTAAKKEKKTTLNFEDELVDGQTTKPELFYLFQKKNFNYKRLIRLRENFLPEMRKTSEDIQRSRSSN